MTKVTVYSSKGKETGKFSVDEEFAKKRVNTKVIYQAVNNYMASRHRGTHKTKKRGEVSGAGKKPWRQKGTGRARVGSIRSPLWRHGGVIFGPVVRSYSYSIPNKVKRLALLEAVKSKLKENDLILFDKIELEKPKTRDMVAILKALGIDRKCLMIMENIEENAKLASRNIRGFSLKKRRDINALDILTHDKLAASEESFKKILEKA